MKRSTSLLMLVLFVMLFISAEGVGAQPSAPPSHPQVPIIYPGDTDQTIGRRARWIEGAKKEGKVVWWGSLRPDKSLELIRAFNRVYPFIEVVYWRGSDTERNNRLETGHAMGNPKVDISEPGDFTTNYPRWRKMDLTENYTEFIPGIETMDTRMYSKYGDWAQIGNNVIVPMYNTNMVSPADVPKTWEDLLDPRWKGKIGMTTDMKAWFTLALDENGWGIEKTEQFLKELKKQKPIWASGHSAGFTLLIAGEFEIFVENYLRYLFSEKIKTAPVDWARVSPVVITGGTFLLTKKAPHPNAVRLFIEWLFSPNTAPLYEKVTGYGAAFPGSGTMTSRAIRGLPAVYRTEEVVEKATELNLVDRFSRILVLSK